ncbi:MAG: rhodanese-like domain-containing protein [Defluviitaleaceae bacterium]|nr:rhodanese-like domain-containing protein [Defluviitaleaceae bacterium]
MFNKGSMIFIIITLAITIPAAIILSPADDIGGIEMTSVNRRISASEAREKMKANPAAIILDVRNHSEFATGHIPGATLLPLSDIYSKAPTVIPYKNHMVLVYCRSGVRSQDAIEKLLDMGYTNVYNFGGIMSWPYEIE